MENQSNIGKMFSPHYGTAAGKRVEKLFKDHIAIAVKLLYHAKTLFVSSRRSIPTGTKSKFDGIRLEWAENAEELAKTIHELDPKKFRLTLLRNLLIQHLETTLIYVHYLYTGKYDKSRNAVDEAVIHIRAFADALARVFQNKMCERRR
jgi:hypothetical protein